MIISASRRSDIPAFYSEWFFEKISQGFVYVKNPFNAKQERKVDLTHENVSCFVFWSKNPKAMLSKIDCISEYPFYFQFTLNAYADDIEQNLPSKNTLIETFMQLSETIGNNRVIWRYDPVLLNEKYTINFHIDNFGFFADKLKGYTKKATFSFIDFYKKINKNINELKIKELTAEEKDIIAKNFSRSAKENGLLIDTCAEDIDLSIYGIEHARCIDDRLISQISGKQISEKKDKNQRLECGCVTSTDIGAYNTCKNGCVYCYAS